MDAETNKLTDQPRLPLATNATGQGLILIVLAFLALGVVMVNSAMASLKEPGAWYARVDVRHAMFAIVAATVLLLLGRFVNYRWFLRGRRLPVLATALLILAGVCSALVYVPGIGHEVGGRYRWIRVGPREYSIGFQPSELLKIAMVVFLAAWLTRPQANPRSFLNFLLSGVIAATCIGLVITEDFGMAVVIALSAAMVMFLAGVPLYYLLPAAGSALAAGYYLITSSPYRMQRMMACINPWSETNDSAYQARQALTAVLAGGWKGAGLGGGVQKLGFLPEDSTDFIFASFCEEWGIRGAALLMALLLAWMWQCRRAASRASDPFGRVLAGALGAMITAQALLHMAVNIVVLPPTGIGLPFISAGGTSLLLMAFAASLIVSVSARQASDPIEAAATNCPPRVRSESRPRPRIKVPRELKASSQAGATPPRPRSARPRQPMRRPKTPGQPTAPR